MDQRSYAAVAYRVSLVSIVINLLLFAGKLAAGITGHSSAMVSDAVHSASDVVSTAAVMVGVRLGAKQADATHEYGHERLESVSALLLAALLALVGGGIGWNGVLQLLHPEALTVPGTAALWAAGVSILCKEGMFHYTRSAARQIDSPALRADAWHHRSDALSSVGALIGIAGARLGLPILDPIASLVICLLILKVSLDILLQAVGQLTDRACSPELEAEMRRAVEAVDGVRGLDLLRTRKFGSRVYVDVELSADGSLPLDQAHGVAEAVHRRIEEQFPQVKHCMVHVNPYSDPDCPDDRP